MPYVEPYSVAISAALVERVKSVSYPLVTHPEGCYTLSGDCYSGELSVRTAPATSSWATPLKKRTTREMERDEWNWLLIVAFNSEVNLEALEASFEENPPRVVRDSTHDLQVDLLLDSAVYVYPVQNDPSQGVKATYRFDAVKTPI